ncbi:translocation protein SEC62, partial [Tremellales sp. Uapishka_1]
MAGPADATPVNEAQKRAPADLKAVVEFLRGKNGPKVRRGVLNGKRIDYFKGKTAIRTLLSPAYTKLKKVPAVGDEAEAQALLVKILPHAFFLRVDRPPPETPAAPGSPKTLLLSPQQSFDPLSHYAWFYEGSPLTTILGGIAMVIVMLAAVMFPLWPVKLRLGVWYLSIGVLILIGAFIGLAIVRLILWCVTVVSMKRAIWIFPNLFEDVGFVDSFIPGWAYDDPPKKKKKKTPGVKSARSEKGKAASETEPASGDLSATTSATETKAPEGVRQRQSATVEEIEDDE